MSGQILDATIVSAPRQRMTKTEKEQVKAGKIPEEWQANPVQLAQKDVDARWLVKYSKSKDPKHNVNLAIFYRSYRARGIRHGLYGVVWGDTAYRSIENEQTLANHGFISRLHRKKPKGITAPPARMRLLEFRTIT